MAKAKKVSNQHVNRKNDKKRLKELQKTQETIARLIKESKAQKA